MMYGATDTMHSTVDTLHGVANMICDAANMTQSVADGMEDVGKDPCQAPSPIWRKSCFYMNIQAFSEHVFKIPDF